MRSAAEAIAVLRLADGRDVVLLSPPSAAAAMGTAWFLAIVEAAVAATGCAPRAVLDCGRDPGHALAALRQGCREIVLRAETPAFAAVASAAASIGAVVLDAAPPAYDPGRAGLDRPRQLARLAAWLAARERATP